MNHKGGRHLYSGLAVLCAAASLILGGKVILIRQGCERGEADMERARAVYTQAIEKGGGGEAAFRQLREQNKDVLGWIRIQDTPIDYPVMQTVREPDYYLNHGFDKNVSAYGAIYMDAACLPDQSCHNIILYGHHMRNGAMFGSLKRYISEDYVLTHRRMVFTALEKRRKPGGGKVKENEYEILAVFRTTANGIKEIQHCLTAETKEDYEALLSYCKAHTLCDTGVAAFWPDQLLTLATCEYSQKNGRLFVVARRVRS